VDRVLDSCFLLLSLSFMTIGQNNTAPAAYALTVTTERLLDHLAEVDLFSAKDLESLEETLTTLTRNVKNAAAEQSPYLVTLLLNRLDSCKKSLVKLQKRLEKYEKPLPKVHETLISILRSISWANTRSKVGPLTPHPHGRLLSTRSSLRVRSRSCGSNSRISSKISRTESTRRKMANGPQAVSRSTTF
jgi:hypothetical protein